MKTARPRISVRSLLVCIAVVGVTLGLLRPLRPMGRETAIRIATRHVLEVYPGINLDEYSISAPSRPDWFEEWEVYFHSKSSDSGILIEVSGGDVYLGPNVNVFVDNTWGSQP
jgi:hypothetical protein